MNALARPLRLPDDYYTPPDPEPDVPEFAIDDAIDAYCANAGDLAGLLTDNHALLRAFVDHVLRDCDGVELHIGLLIRANAAAMERITREVEKSLQWNAA